MRIKRMINTGNIVTKDPVTDSKQLLRFMGVLLDRSEAQEIFGDIVFQSQGGRYYKCYVEGVITEVDRDFAMQFGDLRD